MNISTGVLFGIIAMLCWGSSDIAAKILIGRIGFYRALFWSQLFGLLPMAGIFFLLKQNFAYSAFAYSTGDVLLFILVGILATFGYLLFYMALKKGSVSVQCPVQASSVIITVILSMIFLQEKLSIQQILLVNLTIAGILLISFKLKDLRQLKWKSILPGTPYNFISICCWGINFVLLGYLISKFGWLLPVFAMRIGITAVLFAYFPIRKEKKEYKNEKLFKKLFFPASAIKLIVLLAVLDVIGFLAYGYGINSELVSIVTPVAESFPLVAVVLAGIFLKEKLSFNQMIGFVFILTGIIGLAL